GLGAHGRQLRRPAARQARTGPRAAAPPDHGARQRLPLRPLSRHWIVKVAVFDTARIIGVPSSATAHRLTSTFCQLEGMAPAHSKAPLTRPSGGITASVPLLPVSVAASSSSGVAASGTTAPKAGNEPAGVPSC